MGTAWKVLFSSLLATALAAQDAGSSAPAGTCRVRARICDADGKPIANAGAIAGRPEDVTTADVLQRPQARSDANGDISVDVKVPEGLRESVAVLFAAPGRVPVSCPNPHRDAMWRVVQGPGVDLGELRLPAGNTLTGRVRDADGKPIAGVRVAATDGLTSLWWIGPHYASRAVTGANGVFTLHGVFPRAMQIGMEADGFFTRSFPSVDLGAPLDVVLHQSGFVSGKVVDALGKPFIGSVLQTRELIRASTASAVRVADDGTFRMSVGDAGRYRITVFSITGGFLAESDVLEGPHADVVLRVTAADDDRLQVRAVDAATGARVTAIRGAVMWFRGDRDANLDSWLAAALLPARPDGVVSLDPPNADFAGPGVVLVAGDGYAPCFVEKVAGATRQLEVKLVKAARITGKVLAANGGQPLAGVRVTVDRKAERDNAENRPQRRSLCSVTTAKDGSFVCDGLGADDYVVEARHADGSVVARRFVGVATGEDPPTVDLELAEGVAVRGRLEGAPVGADWRVVLRPAGVDDSNRYAIDGLRCAANVDGSAPVVDGAFVLPHRGGGKETLALVVPAAPRHGAALVIPLQTIDLGSADVDVKVDLTKHLPAVVNVKLALAGAAVPVGRLVVTAAEREDGPRQQVLARSGTRASRWSIVEPDGTCTLRLPPDDYRLAVVDSATGIQLHEEPFVAGSGVTVAWQPKVDVCELTVHIDGGVDRAVTAPRVNCVPAGEMSFSVPAPFGGGMWGSPGVDVAGIDSPVTVFVPPGDVDLHLQGAVQRIARGSVHMSTIDRDKVRITAELGHVNEVTLQMPPRSALDK